MQVSRWGNSLAVRLPAELVRALELEEGDEITLTPDGPKKFKVAIDPAKAEMLERMRSAKWKLPPDYKFDREEANAR